MFDKKGGIVIFVIIFLLVGFAIFALVYFLFPAEDGVNLPSIPEVPSQVLNETNTSVVNETIVEPNETVVNVNDSFANSQEIHWKEMPIKYEIINKTDNCSSKALDEFYSAIDLIESNTNGAVSFEEANSSADLTVYCVQNNELLNVSLGGYKCSSKTFDYVKQDLNPISEGLLAEGDIFLSYDLLNKTSNETKFEYCYVPANAPKWIHDRFAETQIDIDENNTIYGATMNIYSDGLRDCARNPIMEIHDLFHALGIGHATNAQFDPRYGWVPIDYPLLRDVMFPQIQCQFQGRIDSKYYSCLEKIYSGEGSCDDVSFVYFEDGEWRY